MVKQYVLPDSLLGLEANLVCQNVIEFQKNQEEDNTFGEYKREDYKKEDSKNEDPIDVQNMFEYFDFLLRSWQGVNKMKDFPMQLRKPLEKACSTILDLRSDFEQQPNSPTSESVPNTKQITAHIKNLEGYYKEFRDEMKSLDHDHIYQRLFPVSPSATAFWLNLFPGSLVVEGNRFVDGLMQYFPQHFDYQKGTFYGQDTKSVKSYLLENCSVAHKEKQVVTTNSFSKFLREKSTKGMQAEGLKLQDVLSHTLQTEISLLRKFTHFVGLTKREDDLQHFRRQNSKRKQTRSYSFLLPAPFYDPLLHSTLPSHMNRTRSASL